MESQVVIDLCNPFDEFSGAGQTLCIGIHFGQEETLLESLHCGTARDFGCARAHSHTDCGLRAK